MAGAIISAQCAVFTQTMERFVLVKAQNKRHTKRVPALDTQSQMNSLGFNENIFLNLYEGGIDPRTSVMLDRSFTTRLSKHTSVLCHIRQVRYTACISFGHHKVLTPRLLWLWLDCYAWGKTRPPQYPTDKEMNKEMCK